MKKLSELQKDDYALMTNSNRSVFNLIKVNKIDFIIKKYKDSELQFYTTIKIAPKTDIEEVLKIMSKYYVKEGYELWFDCMYYELKNSPELTAFVNLFNSTSEKISIYIEDELILVNE